MHCLFSLGRMSFANASNCAKCLILGQGSTSAAVRSAGETSRLQAYTHPPLLTMTCTRYRSHLCSQHAKQLVRNLSHACVEGEVPALRTSQAKGSQQLKVDGSVKMPDKGQVPTGFEWLCVDIQELWLFSLKKMLSAFASSFWRHAVNTDCLNYPLKKSLVMRG